MGPSVLWVIDEWWPVRTARKLARRLLVPVERRHNAARTALCTQYPQSARNQRFESGLRTDASTERNIHNTNRVEADRQYLWERIGSVQ